MTDSAAPPRFTFEPRFPDGSPRRYVGTWRPPFDEVKQNDPGRGYRPTYHRSLRQEWQDGDYDRTLYAVEEGQ